MMRRMRAVACVLSLMGGMAVVPFPALADTQWLAPPPMYPPDTWKGRSVAVVRILDKLDAHVQVINIPAGQDATYKSLTLHARACLERPPTLAADTAASLTVHDAHEGMVAFDGWMLTQEPAIGVFQNPLYDVQVVGCGGDDVAPVPPPLAVVQQQAASPDAPVPATPGQPAQAASPSSPDAPLPPVPLSPPPAHPAAPPPIPPASPPEDNNSGAAPLLLH
ncbi:DUF2155 domain-containing protein [Novacetimonas cocois]|uniref:DUF2155 domain-containing protein n=1 Tax=Novacetimonas cocois TaxID=1747507 RepID=A0A365YZC1_9PROT|nr:DUF2155 domain-containing protein [Novacetimonas cocois]RBM08008.1 DUF2155 domain-containing protein [Novacetimonas cocois]